MFNPQKHHRRSIRLRGYDYSSSGYYFVTICVQNRLPVLGSVANGQMGLTELGKIVKREWSRIPENYPGTELDEWIIMPNHFHGIVVINEPPVAQTGDIAQTGGAVKTGIPVLTGVLFPPPPRRAGARPAPTRVAGVALGDIVGGFKSRCVTQWLKHISINDINTVGKF